MKHPLALAALCAVSCTPRLPLAERVAAAHGGDLYGLPAVSADLEVEFGGQRVLEGRLLVQPSTGRSRLDLADGTLLVFDGSAAWVSPAEASFQGARFHLRTWPYFLTAPWKLGDPGAHLAPLPDGSLEGERTTCARLTFDAGTGDTPDDWYVVYVDPRTDLLRGLAYVVTYGTTVEAASAEPHAVLVQELADVDGLRFPARLTVHPWSAAAGVGAAVLGVASFRDLRVEPVSADAFRAPPGAREDVLPD